MSSAAGGESRLRILYSVRKSNNIVRTLLEKTMQTADIFFYNQGMKRTRWDDERDFKAGSYPEILRKRRKYHAGDQGHQLLCAGGRVPWDHGGVGLRKDDAANWISIKLIETVSAGHIYLDGTDVTELKEKAIAKFRRENLGFIFQDFNLLDTLTISENIALALYDQPCSGQGDRGAGEGDCRKPQYHGYSGKISV